MNSPQEPVSPSPSTPSSGSPPPDESFVELAATAAAAASQQLSNLSQSKRRLASGPSQTRDIKSRRRDDGAKRSFVQGDMGGREGGRREEFIDMELMERLKQEFGDPFDESDLKALSQ